MSYYGDSQWPAGAQPAGWDHQTPPTRSGMLGDDSDPVWPDTLLVARVKAMYANDPGSSLTGASSTIPREETSAFWYQFEGMFFFLGLLHPVAST